MMANLLIGVSLTAALIVAEGLDSTSTVGIGSNSTHRAAALGHYDARTSSGSAQLAATGTITAGDDTHLIIASGQLSSATLTWSATGTDEVRITQEVSGGSPFNMFVGPTLSGSLEATGLSSGEYYVFKLYAYSGGTWALLDWTSVTTQSLPANMFGFNYWPRNYSCNVLFDANWSTAKPQVEADLDHMSSLGGRVLRLMFWPGGPWGSGFELTYQQGGGGDLTSEYFELTTNIVDLLSLLDERDMRAVISFANTYIDFQPQAWPTSYATIEEFIDDSVLWVNGIVDAIEGSQYRKTVLYYDYNNELAQEDPGIWTYLVGLYDQTNVPMGKRGASVHYVFGNVPNNDLPFLQAALGSRRIDYLEFHTYLARPQNPVTATYAACKSAFPDSTILLGEFGRQTPSPSTEAQQLADVISIRDDVIGNGIPYYLHWTIWDASPRPTQVNGWGYDEHTPKDVMGKWAEDMGLVPNGDFEILAGEVPANWTAGANVSPVYFFAIGSAAQPATGARSGRISVPQGVSGTVWLVSPFTAVEGGRELYINAYIRSTMQNVRIGLIEYDGNFGILSEKSGPSYTPSAFTMEGYLHKVGSWKPTLNSATEHVRIFVLADVSSTNAILDVDTVTVHQFN